MNTKSEPTKSTLLQSLSHDIRGMLSSIIGSSNLYLEKTALTENEKTDLVKNMNKDTAKLLFLTENLILLAKVSQPETEFILSSEHIEEVLSEIGFTLEEAFPNIAPSYSFPEELLFVPINASLLEQYFVNLFQCMESLCDTAMSPNIDVNKSESNILLTISYTPKAESLMLLPTLFKELYTESNKKAYPKGFFACLCICDQIAKIHHGEFFISALDAKNQIILSFPLGA